MSDDLDAIQAIFFDECTEGLAALEAGLSAMASGDTDPETIASVFRAVHSIKGGSGAFGHEALLAFSHRFENVLDALRSGRIEAGPSLVQLLLQSCDRLSDHVAAAREGSVPPDDDALGEELDRALSAEPEAGERECSDDPFGFAPVAVSLADLEPPQAPWRVHFTPSAAALANGGEPLLVLRELERLGGEIIACDASRLPPLDALDPNGAYLDWTCSVPGDVGEVAIRECFDFVPPDCRVTVARADSQAQIAALPLERDTDSAKGPPTLTIVGERRPSDRAEMTIRIDLAKLDGLLNLVGELVIRNSILADRLGPAERDKVELPQLSRLTRQIQDTVMSLRAQPIRQAFNRVPRMLRDLEAETGKKVALEVSGEGTEVDKRVIERIGDPLTHMIRNAVDHGIESAETRRAAGKPEIGTISLSATQKGGRIIVRVEDDGGGINRAAVRARAAERGLIAPDAILSDDQIDALICAPGFSTAQNISNISGRGVGMDVVRSNIEGLGGRLEISSIPGRGTSFVLILPLTLAILDGMVVRLGSQRFVLPLQSVIESIRPEPGQVAAMTPDSEVIELRGNYLPVRRLADFFGIREAETRADKGLVIVVESDSSGPVGLFVDTVEDRREVVIKSLDRNLHPIPGLGGATVLGDGSIALILDVEAIVASVPRDPIIKEKAA